MPLGSFRLNSIGKVLNREAKTFSPQGDVNISTTQSKFGGSSAKFDGTGDYLIVNSVSSDMAFGTGDFTIEMWIYAANVTGNKVLWDQRPSGTNGNYPMIYLDAASPRFYVSGSGRIIGSNISATTWLHLAVVRTGTSTKMYVNGTQSGSTWTDTTNYISASNAWIGLSQSGGTNPMNGYIDEVRVSNTARYTDNFTAPTTAFVNDENTLLLIHADGTNGSTTFIDDVGVRTPKGISAFGNAQVDTAQSKFGGASVYFDGTGDYLSIAQPINGLNFQTSDFTIEAWVYPTNVTQENTIISLYAYSNNRRSWFLGITSSGLVDFRCFEDPTGVGEVYPKSISTIPINTWTHIAVTKSGTNCSFWINGVFNVTRAGIGADVYVNTIDPVLIGAVGPNITSYFDGWIDDLRVSNTVRYTANFTPPTGPFQNDANTLLLVHADGTDGSTDFFDDNN